MKITVDQLQCDYIGVVNVFIATIEKQLVKEFAAWAPAKNGSYTVY